MCVCVYVWADVSERVFRVYYVLCVCCVVVVVVFSCMSVYYYIFVTASSSASAVVAVLAFVYASPMPSTSPLAFSLLLRRAAFPPLKW